MRSGTKIKITGILFLLGFVAVVLVVALPILYSVVVSSEGLSGMILTTIPLGFGLEWALHPVLTASLLMISGGSRK